MCIFSGSVESVASTKILVSKVFQTEIVEQKEKGKKRKFKKPVGKPLQLVVYCNKVVLDPAAHDSISGTPGGTAMILPFPLIKGKNRIAALNMSLYENFFDDVDLLFPIPQKSREFSNSYSLTDGVIDVMKVGSYNVSIVPNYDHFVNLQFDKFNLHPDVTKLLGRYYGKNYGFMVCVLRPQAVYHPFAYVHEIRNNGELFIPTRHYHGNTSAGSRYGTTMGHSVFGKFHDRTEIGDGDGDGDGGDGGDGHHEVHGAHGAHDDLLMDDVQLKNNFYDTLMDGDEYISHQMRRSAFGGGARTPTSSPSGPAKPKSKHSQHSAHSAHLMVSRSSGSSKDRRGGRGDDSHVDWDHEIYVVNRPTMHYDSILSKPGVTMLRANPAKLEQVANYINFSRMPVEIAFGEISDIVKVSINKLYNENHDMFV